MQLLKHHLHDKYKLSNILYNLNTILTLNITNTYNKAHYTNIQARKDNRPNGIEPKWARAKRTRSRMSLDNGLKPERFTNLLA